MYPEISENPKLLINNIGTKLTINITLVACGIKICSWFSFFPCSKRAAAIGTNAPGNAAYLAINLSNLQIFTK